MMKVGEKQMWLAASGGWQKIENIIRE